MGVTILNQEKKPMAKESVKVRVKRDFISGQHGNLTKGEIIEINEPYLTHFLKNNLIEMIDDMADDKKPAAEKKSVKKGKFEIVSLGSGWFNVVDESGNNQSEKNLRKSAAEALLADCIKESEK